MRNENKETNQGKKAIGESMGSRIVLALIVVAVIVTAAKVIPLVRNRVQTSQYPVIELADLQGMELESLSDGKFSFSYPAEDWEVWEQVTTDYHPLTIFYKGTADDGSTSISVAENDTVVTQLKPELLQVMLDGLKEQAPYMVIKESEMQQYGRYTGVLSGGQYVTDPGRTGYDGRYRRVDRGNDRSHGRP